METPLATYQKMSALSTQMVEAAHAGDWERLVTLENTLAKLRDALISNGGVPSEDAGAQTTELIRKILDDSAEVRRHIEPRLKHIRDFIGDEATRRQVAEAYGVE